jgi:5'-deoxynucleotidase YfbR-like HD superfamily hydrolase
MAKMGKRAQEVKYQLNEERKQKAREEYIKSLSPEERAEFFRKEEEDKKKAWNSLMGLMTLSTVMTNGGYNKGGNNNE